MRTLSRRDLLRQGPRALGELLWPALLGTQPQRWFELVQDRDDEDKWHVNLFAGPTLGDVAQGTHLEYRVVAASGAEGVAELRRRLAHPARLQFSDGRRASDF